MSPYISAAADGLLYQPQMIEVDTCGAIGGVKFGMENRSTLRKLAPAPLYPPQIAHDLTRARTGAAAVGSQRLTAFCLLLYSLMIWDCCVSHIGFCHSTLLHTLSKKISPFFYLTI
jgi:hypothetical protein